MVSALEAANAPIVTHDSVSDVLYVKIPCSVIANSMTISGDDFVVVNYAASGAPVGLQLLAPSELTVALWLKHYWTDEIPDTLFVAVQTWLEDMEAK